MMCCLFTATAFRIYFDFSGLHRYGRRHGETAGCETAGELQCAVSQAEHRPVLERVARVTHAVVPRLCVQSADATAPIRALLTATWMAVLLTQVATMVLIGLWDGITAGFGAVGVVHGLGLFVHNRWVVMTRDLWSRHGSSLAARRAAAIAGVSLHSTSSRWDAVLRAFVAGFGHGKPCRSCSRSLDRGTRPVGAVNSG